MIHNIVLPWPNTNLDAIFALREVKGDSIIFNVIVDGLDLTNYKIRFELYDLNMSIKLASFAPSGQIPGIEIETGPSGTGKFKITVPYGATGTAQKYGYAEIELEDQDGSRFTIFQQEILFINERIIWDNPA